MRERLTVKKPIAFAPSSADKIEDAAKRLKVSFAEIVRECVDVELPRLVQREIKRINRQTN